MKKKENTKTATYYSIDFANNKVVMLTKDEKQNSWESIPADVYTTISFNELLNDIIEFRTIFSDFENLKERLFSLLTREIALFHNTLKELYDIINNSSKYFTRYYTDYIYNFFLKERASIKAVILERSLKSAIESINNEFDKIRNAINYEYYFNLKSNSCIQVLDWDDIKYVIRSHDRNEIYHKADKLFSHLFYDLSYIIHNKKLYICKCKYCKKYFFGSENNDCCGDTSCKSKHLNILKNEKRRKKSKGPYEIHITALNDYLSQQTFQLKAIVQEDMYYVNKLKSRNGEFRNRLKDEIERCRTENIIPGHDQDVFLHKLEAEIYIYRTKIADEWKSNNHSNI